MKWIAYKNVLITLNCQLFAVLGALFVTVSSWGTPVSPDTQVVVISDRMHGNKIMLQKEIEFISKLKRQDYTYNCVFLEVEPAMKFYLERFLKGESYKQTLGYWIGQVEKVFSAKLMNVLPDWYILHLHSLGIEIWGGDINWTVNPDLEIIEAIKAYTKPNRSLEEQARTNRLVLEKRNERIASNAISKIKAGKCQKAIIVIGEAHTYKGSGPTAGLTIQEFVTQMGFKVHVADSVMTNEEVQSILDRFW